MSNEHEALELARAIVKRHYPEMPADYSGRRVKIVLDALATTPADPRVGKMEANLEAAKTALAPFACIEFEQPLFDENGWTEFGVSWSRERIGYWFGPSDFRRARSTLSQIEGEG